MQIIQLRISSPTLTFILDRVTSVKLHAQGFLEICTYWGLIDLLYGTSVTTMSSYRLATCQDPNRDFCMLDLLQSECYWSVIFRLKHIQYARIRYPYVTENYIIYSNLTNTFMKKFPNSLSLSKTWNIRDTIQFV